MKIFEAMEDLKDDNWFVIFDEIDYTPEELKQGKKIVNGIEYDLIPLTKIKEYMLNHPKCRIYKNDVEENLSTEEQKFLEGINLS